MSLRGCSVRTRTRACYSISMVIAGNKKTCALGVGLFIMLLAVSNASALDFNGETLPRIPATHDQCNSDVWYCINEHEDTLGYTGEDIDVVATATIDQETFNPLCNLTFEVLFKGASFLNVFGWYEVTRDANGDPMQPALEDMHVMLGCDTPLGQVVSLPQPPGVTEIGFFLANNTSANCVDDGNGQLTSEPSNLFFSQPELNDDDGRVHLLIWQSRANPTAFYFGWEDQRGGGDNDFEDLLTFVTGIQCAGGGDLCDTGEAGLCAQGVEQCRDGELACVPLQTPRDEVCNALDDDCDGAVDEGDDLCSEDMICHRGTCKPRCGGGEFQCAPPLVCDPTGVCVESACLNVDCEQGEVCRAGECVGACDGIVCPHGSACRSGVCVDVCEGVTCDEGFACAVVHPEELNGAAIGLCKSCGCSGCEDGFTCEQNLCVADACVDQTCAEGFRCEAGACVDNCEGAKCPTGMKCEGGACIEDESYVPPGEGGAAGESGGSIGIGSTGIGVGGTTSVAGSIGSSSSSDGQGQGGTSGPLEGTGEAADSGCGCRVAGGPQRSTAWWSLALLGAMLWRRRAFFRGKAHGASVVRRW